MQQNLLPLGLYRHAKPNLHSHSTMRVQIGLSMSVVFLSSFSNDRYANSAFCERYGFSNIRLHIFKILFYSIYKNYRLKDVHPCLFGPPSQKKNVLLSIKSPQSSSGEYKDMRLIPQVLSMIESDLLTKIVYQIDRLLQLSNRHPI